MQPSQSQRSRKRNTKPRKATSDVFLSRSKAKLYAKAAQVMPQAEKSVSLADSSSALAKSTHTANGVDWIDRAMPTKSGTYIFQNVLLRGAFSPTAGVLSQQITMSLSNIINTTLSGGYQVLFEEVRPLRIRARLINSSAFVVGGIQCLYIDRDPADAIVPNLGTASTEPESVIVPFHKDAVIEWTPRDPLEREYQLITAYAALSSFNVICASTLTTDVYSAYVLIESELEFRGRDF
jgi:hypothetical protein